MNRIPTSEKLRNEIDGTLSGQLRENEDFLRLLIERSLKMRFQKILEQEVAREKAIGTI